MAILCGDSFDNYITYLYFSEGNIKINFLRILFWIFVIITFGMILTRIFGHSATDLQILIGILSIFFTNIVDLYYRLGKIEMNMISSFARVESDIKK